jgi:hypothetical protein
MRIPGERRKLLDQRTPILNMLMVFVLVVLLVQLWLISIALEEFLAARTALAVPTFGASAFCFLLSLRLLKYVNDLDRKE